jgi:glycosyltransferase involved in cell wall biosynthesis
MLVLGGDDGERVRMSTVGFACHWDRDPATTWSGTPLHLRAALRELTDVVDLDVTLPKAYRTPLRLAGARRSSGTWRSAWRHSRAAVSLVERRVARLSQNSHAHSVLEIGDLGPTPQPFFIVQDLSYALLLRHHGPRGVPHFRTLGRSDLVRLDQRQREVYEQSEGVFAMSQWLADSLVQDGLAPDRVHVVPPGIQSTSSAHAPLPERRQGTQRRLLFIGRDFDTKGGDQVLAAFALLRAELGPAITLTVAGPPAWPAPGAVPDGVLFLGAVPPAQVQTLYDSHDLFVMPSRFEGFGIVFAEALSRGLPCIGRDACAMPEIIGPGSGGRLVASEDPCELAGAVLDALADDSLYARCAAEAPARRAFYSWDRAARDVLAHMPDQD